MIVMTANEYKLIKKASDKLCYPIDIFVRKMSHYYWSNKLAPEDIPVKTVIKEVIKGIKKYNKICQRRANDKCVVF